MQGESKDVIARENAFENTTGSMSGSGILELLRRAEASAHVIMSHMAVGNPSGEAFGGAGIKLIFPLYFQSFQKKRVTRPWVRAADVPVPNLN